MKEGSKRMRCRGNKCTSVRFPASMLVSAKLSGYLLSLLLAPVLFLAGSESLSQSQILLLLRADAQNNHTSTQQTHTLWGKRLERK